VVVIFEELGTAFALASRTANASSPFLPFHFDKFILAVFKKCRGVIITHVSLPGTNCWAWPMS